MPDDLTLEEALARTRQALLAGDLAALDPLAEAVGAAPAIRPDAPQLLALQQAAERNAALLQAALRGVRAARRRADEILGRSGQGTYDAQGRLDRLPGSPVAPLRRA